MKKIVIDCATKKETLVNLTQQEIDQQIADEAELNVNLS